MHLCGVYAIRHLASGKLYLGSSVHCLRRWRQHRSALNRGEHHALRLQRAWKRYGPSAFSFEFLETVDNRVDLLNIEQRWIESTRCCEPLYGYNVAPQAGSARGLKWTADQRAMQRAHGLRSGISPACRAAQVAAMRNGLARQMQAKAVETRKLLGTYAHSEQTKEKIFRTTRRKLSVAALQDILRRLASRETLVQIASVHGVHTNTVLKIKKGGHKLAESLCH